MALRLCGCAVVRLCGPPASCKRRAPFVSTDARAPPSLCVHCTFSAPLPTRAPPSFVCAISDANTHAGNVYDDANNVNNRADVAPAGQKLVTIFKGTGKLGMSMAGPKDTGDNRVGIFVTKIKDDSPAQGIIVPRQVT